MTQLKDKRFFHIQLHINRVKQIVSSTNPYENRRVLPNSKQYANQKWKRQRKPIHKTETAWVVRKRLITVPPISCEITECKYIEREKRITRLLYSWYYRENIIKHGPLWQQDWHKHHHTNLFLSQTRFSKGQTKTMTNEIRNVSQSAATKPHPELWFGGPPPPRMTQTPLMSSAFDELVDD